MKGTRKQKKQAMSIPQLRQAFDHIESFTQSLVHQVKDINQRRKAFQAEWLKVFKRTVDDKAADAYILFEAKKSTSKTRKTKGQRGGSLGGAPLDYSTRPGMHGVYGIFPDYITQGFATEGNATNNMAIQATCNGPNAFQPPYTGFGATSLAAQQGGKRKTKRNRKASRKYKGGGFMDNMSNFVSSLGMRPITATAPPSALHDAQMMWKGAPVASSSPNANTANPPYIPYKPSIINIQSGAITRDLGSEIQ